MNKTNGKINGNHIFIILILIASAVLMTGGIVKKIAHIRAAEAKPAVIAVIPKGTINMWWEVVHKGALKAAEEEHVSITWNGPETETDREKQIQTVEDALIQNVSAVVLGPNDFKALVRSIEKIKASGIPCVLIDSMADTREYDVFAGTDNYAGGADAARLIGGALNGKGKVLLIRFVQNSASTDERAAGFRDTLEKEFPGITVLAEQYTMGTVDDARQKAEDLLTRFPETDAVFAVNHPTSVGAYKALQNRSAAGRVKFVGFDSDPVLLEGIENGGVLAVIAQNPFEIGYSGVKAAVTLLKKGRVEKNIPIPSMIVQKDNLEEMKRNFPEALGL